MHIPTPATLIQVKFSPNRPRATQDPFPTQDPFGLAFHIRMKENFPVPMRNSLP